MHANSFITKSTRPSIMNNIITIGLGLIGGSFNLDLKQIFPNASFGGIDKADFLKGHEYTYVGAQPGEIVKCLKRMVNKNGIIFLDELDKAAEHPDISAALLHLVDQSQNYDFRDIQIII